MHPVYYVGGDDNKLPPAMLRLRIPVARMLWVAPPVRVTRGRGVATPAPAFDWSLTDFLKSLAPQPRESPVITRSDIVAKRRGGYRLAGWARVNGKVIKPKGDTQ